MPPGPEKPLRDNRDNKTGEVFLPLVVQRDALALVGVLTIPLLIGFALGYGAREMISRRRREAARLRHIND
jgi:hypothetical protein